MDRVTLQCSASSLDRMSNELETLRSGVRMAIGMVGNADNTEITLANLYRVEVKLAEVQGLVDAMIGWFAEVKEGGEK